MKQEERIEKMKEETISGAGLLFAIREPVRPVIIVQMLTFATAWGLKRHKGGVIGDP